MSSIRSLLAVVVFLAACGDNAPTAPTDDVAAGGLVAASHGRPGPGPSVPVTPVAASDLTIVMHGLDSPKGMAWGPGDALYVVETGDNVVRGPCATVARGLNCYSGSGAISRLWKGRQERVVAGLPSWFNPAQGDVGGPNDIALTGLGAALVTIGWGGDPAVRAELGDLAAGFGYLVQISLGGGRNVAWLPSRHPSRGKVWKAVADIAGLESLLNPDQRFIDSNPFGLLVEPARRFVTDAGGNSLLEVRPNGHGSLVAAFPVTPAPPPFLQSEAVPTAVRRGPDGALYVSTLSGVPFLAGAAKIYRVAPGQGPAVFAGGFTTITDFAFARDGSLYVLEFAGGPLFFAGPGQLVHVATDGTRTAVVQGLREATSLLVAPHGAIFIAQKGGTPSVGLHAGEVLRYNP